MPEVILAQAELLQTIESMADALLTRTGDGPFAGRVDREPAHQAPKVAASHLQVVAPGVGRAKVALPARLEALDVASQQGFAFGRAF